MSEHKENRDTLFPQITRRGLLKAGSALVTLPFVMSGKALASSTHASPAAQASGASERVVQTCSTFDCGGKCDIRAHVADGVITQITTRPDSDLDPEMPIMRACVRGRGYRKFVYHPDRLKYPMKRVGKRGEGKFERISWDE
ncbi:MAG: dimethyl sulfoxide reductase subunit A, partial [Silvania sp.]